MGVNTHVTYLSSAWVCGVVCYRGTCPLGSQLLCSSQTQHWRRWSSVFSGRVTLQSHDCLKGLKNSGCKTHFPGMPTQTVFGAKSRQMWTLPGVVLVMCSRCGGDECWAIIHGIRSLVNVTRKRILVDLHSRRSRYPPPHEDNVSRQRHAICISVDSLHFYSREKRAHEKCALISHAAINSTMLIIGLNTQISIKRFSTI